MDKLDNESWEEYALRNELFEIKYADDKQIIDEVIIPNPDFYYGFLFNDDVVNKTPFKDIIWCKIEEIARKYNLVSRQYHRDDGLSNKAKQLLTNEDNERIKYLYESYKYWKEKENNLYLTKNDRYVELIKIISETHKEQLKELLSMIRGGRLPIHPNDEEQVKQQKEEEKKINEQKKEILKKEHIELYHKYQKKNKIKTQIIELKKQITQLNEELCK